MDRINLSVRVLSYFCIGIAFAVDGGALHAQPLTSDAPVSNVPVIEEPALPPVSIPAGGPLLQPGGIKEEDLTEDPSGNASLGTPFPGEAGTITLEQPMRQSGEPIELQIGIESRPGEKEDSRGSEVVDAQAPAVAEDPGSLMAKIKPETTPRRAASLRLTEEGRQLVNSGEYQKALQRLEQTISIDSTNPYSYYFLGLVHFHMANHQASANFLDVAESLLTQEPHWMARVYALKGKNFQAQGDLQQADVSFALALKMDPNNQTAFEALTRIQNDREKSF